MILRKILKKIRQIEVRVNRIAICVLAWLAIGNGQTVLGTPLSPEVSINQDAGCGGWFGGGYLTVILRLETGEEVVFEVDTGSPISVLDDSLKSKLGKQVGTMTVNFVGSKRKLAGIYTAPMILLGDVPLLTTNDDVICTPLKKNFKKHFQGILGMDCLQAYCVQLDFAAGCQRTVKRDHLGSKRGPFWMISDSPP